MIYLDHNSTTPCDPRVVDAMRKYWGSEFGNADSPHRMGRRANQAISQARGSVAEALCCNPSEIIFTSGATESNNLLFLSALAAEPTERRKVVISSIEHKSVGEPARLLSQHGFDVCNVITTTDGVVDLQHAEDLIDDHTLLVSVQMVNNVLGTVQPIEEIGRICQQHGAFFHSDAAQAFGKLPVDARSLGCDVASISAHKAYGPKGVGALYVRGGPARWRWPKAVLGGGQERGIRPGTRNVPGIVGMGVAAELIGEAFRRGEVARLRKLEENFVAQLTGSISGVTVICQSSARTPGVLAIGFGGVDASLLVDCLSETAVSRGSACSGATAGVSHVLSAIRCPDALARSTIRVSMGRATSASDITAATEDIRAAVARIRETE